MKQIQKKVVSLLAAFALVIGLCAVPVGAAGQIDQKHYLSLGDSLAKGMYYDGTEDDDPGFSDMVAKKFEAEGQLGSYSKEFAVSGSRTDNLSEALSKNQELDAAIKKANVISISIGANDLLSLAKLNPDTKMLEMDQTQVIPKLGEINDKYKKILATIKGINSEAQIYVMGYYFPYPHLNEQQKPTLIQLAKALNSYIESAANDQGVHYVDVYSKFGDDPKQYLPAPLNIHPNEEGYKLMADALYEQINKVNEPQPEQPQPVIINDIKNHTAKKELQYLADLGLLKPDSKGNVYPDKEISRAEVAQMLYGGFPHILKVPEDPGFKDVPSTHPAYMAIASLTEMGVFSKAEKFNPNSSLERGQMAKIFSIALGLKQTGNPASFNDINSSYWGYEYVQAMVTNGLMKGYTNGTFNKNGKTTKAQFAIVLVRALEKK